MNVPATDNEASFTYVWNWFALHAGQRLQMFNFWLVAVAFLGTAFVQARVSNLLVVAAGVSVAGVIASVAFLLLDMRSRDLIRVAEAALREIEAERTTAGGSASAELVQRAHQQRSLPISSYHIVIQSVQAAIATLFLLATIYVIL